MSTASRVPLLPKGKSRKPTRLTIAPRARPANVDRSKRVATPEQKESPTPQRSDVQENVALQDREPVASVAEEKRLPSTVPLASNGASRKAPPRISVNVVSTPSTSSAPALASGSGTTESAKPTVISHPRRAGGISIGGSLSTPAPASKPVTPVQVTRSPIILPVQRRSDKTGGVRVERLAKMSSSGPVYRTNVSPVLGPRVTVSPKAGQEAGNPLLKRMAHKLDIKPHQSPRRAGVQLHGRHPRTESISSLTNSPFALTARAPHATDKGDLNDDVLGEGVVGGEASRERKDREFGVKTRQGKRQKVAKSSAASHSKRLPTPEVPQRPSLQRKAKASQSYRNVSDTEEEGDDDQDEDVDLDELNLPEEAVQIYVPARERATMWAKSLLNGDGDQNDESENSRALALVAKEKTSTSLRNRRKRSNSNASSISSLVSLTRGTNRKKAELLKKEPSQMTMGELALTIPKGRRLKRHEREEAESSAVPGDEDDEKSSSLLNMNALKRVRSLSVSSESAAMGGSLVTPQVQIIDGKMVILESTIKLGEETHQQHQSNDDPDEYPESGMPPRHSGPRFNSSHPNGPGRRWGKDETKQFYYCLSQVGPNFSMMATLFPKRKRKELKSKFKYEEKNHPKLIEIALRASAAPLDSEMVDVIAKMVDKEEQRKLDAQKKKRRRRSSVLGDEDDDGEDDDDANSEVDCERPLSPTVSLSASDLALANAAEGVEEEVEDAEDDDDFGRERRDSFDFAG